LSEKKEENVFAISANLNLAMTKFFIDWKEYLVTIFQKELSSLKICSICIWKFAMPNLSNK
jgi:hypothetical protein